MRRTLLALVALATCACSPQPSQVASRSSSLALTSQGQVVTFPLEVLGADETVRSVTVPLPEQELQSPLKLWLQVHSLSYEDKASIRFNEGAWISLNNSTAFVEGLGKNYGGIGGAFATLKLRVDVPAGALVPGENKLDFKFNESDGRSIGFRVLKLNFLRLDGSRVLAESLFTQEDPNTWQPPYSDETSIAEGAALWRDAVLRQSSKDPSKINARCMDCHTRDGRDLKYFNYSNHSIIERSKFHGLDEEQGKKIASYIRTLQGIPNPGRPWNPPYQPGPNVAGLPVTHWAAGAGIDQVLEKDRDIFPYIFPGFPQKIDKQAVLTTGNLNTRTTPIPLQLPDWNHWLPTIHPKDGWGSVFTDSDAYTCYNGDGPCALKDSMRERARQVKADGYTTYNAKLFHASQYWTLSLYQFLSTRYPTYKENKDPLRETVEYNQRIYSIGLWSMVKMWEIMQEFGLEGHQKQLFPSSREEWGWMNNRSFDTSPHLMGLIRDKTGIGNNTPLMFVYFSAAWYQLAFVLYHGNHSDGLGRDGQRPIDWPYAYGFLAELQYTPANQSTDLYVPLNGLLTLWLVKAMQVADNGIGPDGLRTHPAPDEEPLNPNIPSPGWQPRTVVDLSRLVVPGFIKGWGDTSLDERRAIMEALLSTWWDKTRQYPDPAVWLRNPNTATTTEAITGHYDGTLGNRIWYMLPQFRHYGVSQDLVNAIAGWAKTVWTQRTDWDRVKTAGCWPHQHYYVCCTELADETQCKVK
ncbi:hypothetical protein F0U60_45245 [Archangium minus]|uniref:Cytochrome c domain-containing protein n=1 Tax=Archangium minus TaxID=83450 RepID=A0ABY9X572_9BACT|nr:hypothetical protein F0U60_45245 [Archangium minus]